jgi:hypothetical protein
LIQNRRLTGYLAFLFFFQQQFLQFGHFRFERAKTGFLFVDLSLVALR